MKEIPGESLEFDAEPGGSSLESSEHLPSHWAEEALKLSENKYRELVDEAASIILRWDTRGHVTFFNEFAQGFFGFSEQEIIGRSVVGTIVPEQEFSGRDLSQLMKEICLDPAKFEYNENENIKRNGDRVWIAWKNRPVFSDKGALVEILSVGIDITARKCAEDALKEREQHFRTLFEHAPDPVYIVNMETRFVDVNQQMCRELGYSHDELLDIKATSIDAQLKSRLSDTAIEKLHTEHGRVSYETVHRRKDGGRIPVEVRLSAITLDGNPCFLAFGRSLEERKRTEARIRELAYHDPLTGLANRTLFRDRLEHAIAQAGRNSQLLGLLYLDLDRFKVINDSLGHVFGDRLLIEVAHRLQSCVREGDTVARLGGDEFTILAEAVNHVDDVANIARKMLDVLSGPFSLSGHELSVSASIGIAIYPLDDVSPDQLTRDADTAMYRAKEVIGNSFQFYTAEMGAQVKADLLLDTQIRQALTSEQFILHYQPQVCLSTGKIFAVEALLRWKHPDRGLLSPESFISVAEETGLIVPIGEALLLEACVQMREWRDAGIRFERIAVNVSGLQFHRSNFAATVRRALEQTELTADCLELEINENFLMQRPRQAISVLMELKELGLSLAIDDFGTGYSSLSYLKQLPIDRLKIDRSFVKDIPEDPDNEAIVRAVVGLGQSLRLDVIAEGVETPEQAAFLMAQGCDEAQGFLYGRPVKAKALTRKIIQSERDHESLPG